jgi:hypothetical protein
MSDRKIIDHLFEYHSNLKELETHVIAANGEGWEFHSVISHGLHLISVMVIYE